MLTTRLTALFFFLLLGVSSAAALAQADAVNAPPPAVTISVSAEGVRFTSSGLVYQMRLEVFAEGGDSLFNSGFQPGTVRDWPLRDQWGQPPADGTYLCVVTVRDPSGKLSARQGTVLVQGGQASVQLREVADAGNVEPERPSPPATRGAETADIVTPGDGSNTEGDKLPALSAAGTGTQNRVAKWIETGGAGTLSDSALFEFGGFVGVGTNSPEGTLHIQSTDTTVFKSVTSGTATTGRSIFQMYRGTAAASFGWDFGYNADLSSENFIVRELTNAVPTTRLTVAKSTGNVGIGASAPTQKLEVGGNIKLTGAGNGIIFPDGTKQTTAGAGGGVSGSGTTSTLPLWSGPTALGNSVVTQSAGNIGIGTTGTGSKLTVAGVIESTTGGVKFPDGTVQTTSTLQGPAGPQGPPGPSGVPPTSYVSGFNVQEISCSGQLNTRTLTFTKNSDASKLRITYSDNLGYYGTNNSAVAWEVRLDGASIAAPHPLKTTLERTQSGEYTLHYQATLLGYALNIAAGAHTLTVHVNIARATVFECTVGHQSTFTLQVEEIP